MIAESEFVVNLLILTDLVHQFLICLRFLCSSYFHGVFTKSFKSIDSMMNFRSNWWLGCVQIVLTIRKLCLIDDIHEFDWSISKLGKILVDRFLNIISWNFWSNRSIGCQLLITFTELMLFEWWFRSRYNYLHQILMIVEGIWLAQSHRLQCYCSWLMYLQTGRILYLQIDRTMKHL